MKKVYDCEQFIYIEGETRDFVNLSMFYHLHLLDDEAVNEIEARHTFKDFNSLWNYVGDNVLYNVECHTTLFGARQIIVRKGLDYYIIREKKYKKVTIWFHCAHQEHLSFRTLMDNLPHEEMAEFMIERAIDYTDFIK